MDKVKNKNKTLIPKIICLLLSTCLWIYISTVENPVRTYEVKSIPVELVNLENLESSNLAISGDQNYTVDLKLEGPSTEVIRVKPEDFKVVADMSTYALKSGENTIPVQVISYPENINIKNNGFLGIKVNLEEIISKEVNIQSRVKLNYKSNVYESSKKIIPNTVTIKGAKSKVEKVDSAVIDGEENEISKDFENNYNIKFIDSLGNEITGIKSDITTAKLSVQISNSKNVPINLKTSGNLKPGLILEGQKLDSEYVNITGNNDVLKNIQSIDTEMIDISSLSQSTELNVKLVLPEGITTVNGQNSVKVNIVLKNEENVTKTLSVTVQYNNLKEEFNMESSTEKINVTVSGTQTELDKINENSLQAVLELSTITQEGTYSYKADVSFKTPTTAVISVSDNVEVVIKKKTEQ